MAKDTLNANSVKEKKKKQRNLLVPAAAAGGAGLGLGTYALLNRPIGRVLEQKLSPYDVPDQPITREVTGYHPASMLGWGSALGAGGFLFPNITPALDRGGRSMAAYAAMSSPTGFLNVGRKAAPGSALRGLYDDLGKMVDLQTAPTSPADVAKVKANKAMVNELLGIVKGKRTDFSDSTIAHILKQKAYDPSTRTLPMNKDEVNFRKTIDALFSEKKGPNKAEFAKLPNPFHHLRTSTDPIRKMLPEIYKSMQTTGQAPILPEEWISNWSTGKEHTKSLISKLRSNAQDLISTQGNKKTRVMFGNKFNPEGVLRGKYLDRVADLYEEKLRNTSKLLSEIKGTGKTLGHNIRYRPVKPWRIGKGVGIGGVLAGLGAFLLSKYKNKVSD